MFYFSRNSRSQSQQDDIGDLPSRGGVGTADSGDWKEVRIKVIFFAFFSTFLCFNLGVCLYGSKVVHMHICVSLSMCVFHVRLR